MLRFGRHRFAGLVLVPVLAVAGCTSAPAAPPAPATPAPASSAAAATTAVDPQAFARVVADPRTFTLNVHVPDAGAIAGTDTRIPYDRIRARAAELPRDRATRIAVYCRSGRMSAEAVPTLRALGYTDIVELRGGMDAWVAAGRRLIPIGG